MARLYRIFGQLIRVGQRPVRTEGLDAIFQHSSDAILLTDAHGMILRANPAAERLTGRTEAELGRLHLWEEVCRTPGGDPLQPEACPVTQVARTGRAFPCLEATVAAGDGRLLPVTASFSPVPGGDGAVAQVAVVLRDLSENRALEPEIARLLAESEQRHRQAEVLEERERLARDIHDGLAQSLTLLHLRLEKLQLRARAGTVPDLADELDRIKAACLAAYGDVRQAIMNLRQRLPAGTDLGGYLTQYLQEFRRLHDLDVELLLPLSGIPALAPAVEARLIRIIQEALHNVIKHARAQHVAVRLDVRGAGLSVSVADDGIGFDPQAAGRTGQYGLEIMRERARQAGGHLTVGAAPGAGARIEVTIPLAASEPGYRAGERGAGDGADSHPAGG